MKGFVEVYKTGKKGKELIYEDSNMIVDGAGESIVSFLTRETPPSSMGFVANSHCSSFNIRAMTLGGPQDSYSMRDSRFSPSSILENEQSYHDKTSRYNLLDMGPNWNFSSYGPNAFDTDKRRVQLLYDTSLTGTLAWGEDLLQGKGYFDNWKLNMGNPKQGSLPRGWYSTDLGDSADPVSGPYIEPHKGGMRMYRPLERSGDAIVFYAELPTTSTPGYHSAMTELGWGTEHVLADEDEYNLLAANTQYYKIVYDLVEKPKTYFSNTVQFLMWNYTSGRLVYQDPLFTAPYKGEREIWNMTGDQRQGKRISEVFPLADKLWLTDDGPTSNYQYFWQSTSSISVTRGPNVFRLGHYTTIQEEADVTLANIKVFKYNSESGGEWDIETLGNPAVDQTPEGMHIDSSNRGDQVTLRQYVGLEKGGSYRFVLNGSGTDGIEFRLYRIDTKFRFSTLKEYYDFDKNVFLPKKNTFVQFPESTIPLDSKVKDHVKIFHIPGHKAYDSGERYEYVVELVIPKDSEDKFSSTFLHTVELYDETAHALENPTFTNHESLVPNSELTKWEYAESTHGPQVSDELKALNIVDLDDWPYSLNFLADSETPTAHSYTSGSIRWEASSNIAGREDVSNDGSIVLRATYNTWDSNNKGTSRLISNAIELPQEIYEHTGYSKTFLDGPQSLSSDKVYMNMSCWFKVDRGHASTTPKIEIHAEQPGIDSTYYVFSGNGADVSGGQWLTSAESTTYSPVPKLTVALHENVPNYQQGEWSFFSRNVFLDSDIFFSGTDARIRMSIFGAASGADLSWNDVHIKDFSFGKVPGWNITNKHLNPSFGLSTDARKLEDGGLRLNFAGPGSPVPGGTTTLEHAFSDVDISKQYFIALDYTPRTTATQFKASLLHHQPGSLAADTRMYQFAPASGHWETVSPNNPASDVAYNPIVSGTKDVRTQKILGPIHGMDDATFGFDDESVYTLSLQQDSTHKPLIDLHSVKLVDSAHLLYTNPPKVGLIDDTTSKSPTTFTKYPPVGGWGFMNTKNQPQQLNIVNSPNDPLKKYIKWEHSYGVSGGGTHPGHLLGDGALLYRTTLKDSPFKKLKPNGDYHKYALSLGLHLDSTFYFYFQLFAFYGDWDNTLDASTFAFNPNSGSWIHHTGNSQAFNDSTASISTYPFTDVTTPTFFIDESFTDDVKLMVKLIHRLPGAQETDPSGFAEMDTFKMYEVFTAADVSGVRSYPPNPTDSTLQPVSEGAGKEGHFLNYIEFSATPESSGLTYGEILQHGCYLPGSGTYMHEDTFGDEAANTFSGVLSGTLNKTGVVNSEGFIMPSPVAVASQTIADSSAGFVTSALGDLSATREIKYILTLTAEEWKFLDYYYGGIGNIGLWTIDYEATAKKLGGEFGKPPFIVPESGTPYAESLYNLTDTTLNPVYKLFAKKVFAPGGLKIPEGTAYDEHLTIVWGIKF